MHGSAISGRETIYCDKKLILTTRSFATKTKHEFSLDNESVSVEFGYVNFLSGKIQCRLIVAEQVLAEEEKVFSLGTINDKALTGNKATFAMFILGAAVGYSAISFLLQ